MHKVEEESWFLMQARWMLLMEEGRTLHLLRAVPRAWLAGGQRIGLNRMPSYFGGVYDRARECVAIENPSREGTVHVEF